MIRIVLALLGVTLFPVLTVSGDSATPACVEALEQLATLNTRSPVYKLPDGGQKQFINDAERPGEIARLQNIIDANCSANPEDRRREQSEARRLHTVRSPDCTAERDKLALMEKANSHDSPSSVAQQRQRVTERCTVLETPTNVWLVQAWIRPR